MQMAKSIPEYFDSNPEWKAELEYLRNLTLSTEMVETLKWGIPTYTINGKNVVSIGAFKSYVGLWFFQGVFLSDYANVLINAQEGTTKGLRQWRFESIEHMDASLILSYLEEAIQNQKDGKEIKIERKKVAIPEILQKQLEADVELKKAFEKFTAGKQREFNEYLNSAKREETKLKRLDKIIPMVLNGIGLNDKYR
ncbi:MAG: YdeI/OmpD-associated family protein [Bacteroidia bacterium]